MDNQSVQIHTPFKRARCINITKLTSYIYNQTYKFYHKVRNKIVMLQRTKGSFS